MAQQLTIFIENRPGRMESVTRSLVENSINVKAFALQDRGDFGLMKLIVDKPQQAYLKMADNNFACALKEIMAVSVPDKPGNLHNLMTALAAHNVNVIDAYGFVIEPNKQGICCLEIENLKSSEVQGIVEEAGFTVLAEEELYEL